MILYFEMELVFLGGLTSLSDSISVAVSQRE